MKAPVSVNIARLLYLLVCELAGLALALSTKDAGGFELPMWAGLLIGLVVAGFFIFVETLIKNFTLRGFSTATFGLLVGLFCGFLLTRVGISDALNAALTKWFELDSGSFVDQQDLASTITLAVDSMLYASLGFLGAVLALRSTRDDFAFIIPYVRFRQEGTSGQPIVLDAEAIMDGRFPGVVAAGFLTGRLIVPQFVLDGLQSLAASDSQADRVRAERGLELLEGMKNAQDVSVSVEDVGSSQESGEESLLQAVQLLSARLLTLDDNLGKVARLRGLDVLNLHDLTDALKPSIVIGEKLRLPLVRAGKDEHQAVGYLPDGTMIVVNQAVSMIGKTCDVRVISTLQTAGGTMIFSELENRG